MKITDKMPEPLPGTIYTYTWQTQVGVYMVYDIGEKGWIRTMWFSKFSGAYDAEDITDDFWYNTTDREILFYPGKKGNKK